MRLLGSIFMIFGFLFLASKIPEFIHLMIDWNLVPDEPAFRNNIMYQFGALLALYIELIIIGLICVSIMLIYSKFLDSKYHRAVNKAADQSYKQYGTELLYFTFLDEKYHQNENFYISHYPYHLIRSYELENGIVSPTEPEPQRTDEELKIAYETYRKELGLPAVKHELFSLNV
ncbi:hypothetical protein GLW08_20565 [Pontibacillus yanchengensis]|uniref:Uncharacterized protein n=2 Tax=Pontibacillus yanchengensis TaxID=462910 RepID=A0A6I5A5D1_9BACI|nr:hypothetical protein [Pontibacillus yanchengensis]MYL35499.1 hypothetical protein [Pontibacillus yanchengensis]MYL55699.1 hypothetical protein [Pontibacillus yanchengensis]